MRKAAFQEYAVASAFNSIRIPSSIAPEKAASIGVAFVTAAIALGVCLGVRFPRSREPQLFDLLEIAKRQELKDIPEDIASDIIDSISPGNQPYSGDWILVMGGTLFEFPRARS
jgi:NADPH:quinone reductase-like Zn-dependent oxidoreductase